MIGRLSIMKNHNERIEHFSLIITVPYLTSHEICQLFGDFGAAAMIAFLPRIEGRRLDQSQAMNLRLRLQRCVVGVRPNLSYVVYLTVLPVPFPLYPCILLISTLISVPLLAVLSRSQQAFSHLFLHIRYLYPMDLR